ncbi:MAG TPA: phospholipid carrier-dependent glycosyltransferase [Candidatus Limnocylindrales bacterium]|nr:phospholipid carrier-dependent glycosyltransferase [Candidatus Limnocylindrales bacterium]
MIGPDPGADERGTGAPPRSTGIGGAVGAILIVLVLGLALRLVLLYLLPGAGFDTDLASFRAWAADLARNGVGGFYARPFFHDYPPGYMYVLWLVGTVGSWLGGVGDLIKIPPVLADLGVAYLVWSMVRELGGSERSALIGATAVMVNPVFWFDNVVWGQVDSFGLMFLLLGLRALWRDQPAQSAVFAVIAAVIKPQLGILIPIVALIAFRRSRREPLRVLRTGLAGYLTAVVLCFPFGLSVIDLVPTPPFLHSGLLDQVAVAGAGYPYLTVNAYNAWALVPGDLGVSLAHGGQWVCDAAATAADRCGAGIAQYGPIPAAAIGAVLLLLVMVTVLIVIWRRPDRLTLLVGLAIVALAFFAAPTRVHERYGFPFFALGAILLAVSPRWRLAYLLLSIATFLNLYVVLTTLYPPDDPLTNPVRDWLGIGDLIRSEAGVIIVVLLHSVTAVWVWLQVRAPAAGRLSDEATSGDGVLRIGRPGLAGRLTGGSPSPVSPAAVASSAGTATAAVTPVTAIGRIRSGAMLGPFRAGASLPTWSDRPSLDEVGLTGWVADRLRAAPFRADRTATLRHEGGGRLDRLDVWLLVVVLLSTLGLRLFRLAEPYQMHFDEVYHARTATEFLQSWRYGEDHDIYEWTHPHLAKYAMAAGLVLWGGDHVEAMSDLGAPVRAVAIEHRRVATDASSSTGERVYLATDTGILVEDLRTRDTIRTIDARGITALAVDETGARLVAADGSGAISTIDLDAIEASDSAAAPLSLTPLADVGHPIAHLLVTDDGTTILGASDQSITSVDAASGDILGTGDYDGIADLAPAGSGPNLSADRAAIDDPAAVASTLAGILGTEAAEIEARLTNAAPDATVLLGSPGSGETRKKVDAAIADGRLPGVSIVDLPRVALATVEGIAVIDPTTTALASSISLDGGAHGLGVVTGIDQLKLYATVGSAAAPGYEVIKIAGDDTADGPVDLGRHPLPGPGTRVAYDEASQEVHILGQAPHGASGWTVYVIEPHANAVYTDAALPYGFVPAGWAMDVDSAYPSEDREQLLVADTGGRVASIDVGSHAFAWRLPGVIAGVLTAVALYLLTRILFRRRLVAGLVALFTLVDGMTFVQARIGMNDVYVGLFIVAAYALFAAIWTGWWRSRAAFWVGLPIVGSLLGLALASKWVAAYAIGALVLLLLVRSALGRVVAVLGLLAITAVLGHAAISVPTGQGAGNLPFLTIMIALTLLAVIVAIFRPVAWTDEEMWVALAAPTVAGAALFFGALATGHLGTAIVLGPISATPLLLAIAASLGSIIVYAAFRIGAALGYGPLAVADSLEGSAAILDPPAPPPTGWALPGRWFGLPLAWAALSLIAIPLAVYLVSYLPWAAIGGHRLWPGFPAGHTGQTLADLTRSMYAYHNDLTTPHPASSPWWAFPFDLKPVWFYQEGLAGGTSAAIYDSGNLVIWWFGLVAVAFVSVMAFRRRSLALALVAIAFAGQWVPWARIDRAAFQYHYYTALPFLIIALAYLVAELWQGASRRTWLAVRLAGAGAVLAPALLWLFSRPLCALVGVTIVNPGSQACPAVIPDVLVTVRTIGLLSVVAIGAIVLGRSLSLLQRSAEDPDAPWTAGPLRASVLWSAAVAAAFVGVTFLPDVAVLTWRGIPVEPVALIVLLPLLYLAGQILAARDGRRFAAGLAVACVAWFLIWYPNLSALPLPAAVVNAYQGVLPTYLYAFQFPVNTAPRTAGVPLLSPAFAVLTLAIAVTCLVVAYSASTWRLALAESKAAVGTGGSSDDDSSALARTGGGA